MIQQEDNGSKLAGHPAQSGADSEKDKSPLGPDLLDPTKVESDSKQRKIGSPVFDDTSPIDVALQTILVWDPGGDGWPPGPRISARYRRLFHLLTPRQIKAFLRDRLLAAEARTSEGPALTLLDRHFRPLSLLRECDPASFRLLAHAARATVESCGGGRVTSQASEMFRAYLHTIVQQSTSLSEQDMPSLWPQKGEERELLLQLLILAITDNDQPHSPEPAGAETEQTFTEWVEAHMGQSVTGVTIAEQVASFTNMVVQARLTGAVDAASMATAYADSWLERHRRFYAASVAPSLSNLAVVLDDVAGSELQCYRLFDVASEVDPDRHRIRLFYAEFLLDVLDDKERSVRLTEGLHTDEATLRDQVVRLLDPIRDEEISAIDRLYRDTLHHREQVLHESLDSASHARRTWAMILHNAEALLAPQSEGVTRLNALLDSAIGERDAALRVKAQLLTILWWARVARLGADYEVSLRLANDLVGESAADSLEETVGLKMNAGHLMDPAFVEAQGAQILGGLWSQSGMTIARRGQRQVRVRVALSFICSDAYGDTPRNQARRSEAWTYLQTGQPYNADAYREIISRDPTAMELLSRFVQSPEAPEPRAALVQHVFSPDCWPPITNAQDLISAFGWAGIDWLDGQTIQQAAEQLLAHQEGGHEIRGTDV